MPISPLPPFREELEKQLRFHLKKRWGEAILPAIYRNDRDAVWAIVSHWPNKLCDASPRLRADRELVEHAIRHDRCARGALFGKHIHIFPPEIRNDRELQLLAAQCNIWSVLGHRTERQKAHVQRYNDYNDAYLTRLLDEQAGEQVGEQVGEQAGEQEPPGPYVADGTERIHDKDIVLASFTPSNLDSLSLMSVDVVEVDLPDLALFFPPSPLFGYECFITPLGYLPDALKTDRKVVVAFIDAAIHSECLVEDALEIENWLPEPLRADLEIAFKILKLRSYYKMVGLSALTNARTGVPALGDNETLVMAAVRRPTGVQNAPDLLAASLRLRANRNIVKAALTTQRDSKAHMGIPMDEELACLCVGNTPWNFTNGVIRNDFGTEAVLRATLTAGCRCDTASMRMIIGFFPAWARSDYNIALLAINCHGGLLTAFSNALRSRCDLNRRAAQRGAKANQIAKELRNDPLIKKYLDLKKRCARNWQLLRDHHTYNTFFWWLYKERHVERTHMQDHDKGLAAYAAMDEDMERAAQRQRLG